MTSTVEAKVDGGLVELFSALFPCASIIGAPKISTMREIARFEGPARGPYTGAIGWILPGTKARFAVAIRTVSAVASEETLTYGVGSGIVWDSDCESEWRECLLKGQALKPSALPWGLVETTRWTREDGYWLLEAHLKRLGQNAHEFGIPFDEVAIRDLLASHAQRRSVPSRVRLVLSYNGSIDTSVSRLVESPEALRARIAPTPVCQDDPALQIKSTRRHFYEWQMRGFDEAHLWNERGEVTEFCNGNVVASLWGRLVTPPLECGLLPGTMRAELLRLGEIEEDRIALDNLTSVSGLYRINSVRGRQSVEIVDAQAAS